MSDVEFEVAASTLIRAAAALGGDPSDLASRLAALSREGLNPLPDRPAGLLAMAVATAALAVTSGRFPADQTPKGLALALGVLSRRAGQDVFAQAQWLRHLGDLLEGLARSIEREAVAGVSPWEPSDGD